MTLQEFSDEFDVLLNSYGEPNMPIGISPQTMYKLDEYEKSVFLTEAQDALVKGLYTGKMTGESLERTEELRRELDALIVTCYPESTTGTGVSSYSYFYTLPDDLWFITYESVDLGDNAYCSGNSIVRVIPMLQDDWHRAKDNPFRQPNKRKAIRLDSGSKTVEIISKYPISSYLVRYLRKPNPIILTNLDDLQAIDGITTQTECELSTLLHRPILEAAVQLAKARVQQPQQGK